MSRRKALTLIALTWAVALALGVLPWVWPWYRHALVSAPGQDYVFLTTGAVLGWITKGALIRRAG